MIYCQHCGHERTETFPVGQRETCDGCRADLHSCRHCRHCDAGASSWCREPQAREARPRGIDEANRCDWFVALQLDAPPARRDDRSARAKSSAEKLFG